jgi:DNA-binding response OmpR family regulator
MSSAPPSQAKPKKRVLIAEDDPAISRMLEKVLCREYEVVLTADGREAVASAAKVPPHLLLLDIMMPGLDGLSVARQIREMPRTKNVPIIFLTAKDGPMDVIKGIQFGARHYITKPFKIDDLIAKVKKVLGA